jgi:alpha-tubulin suppressor-like RCC1 family protein
LGNNDSGQLGYGNTNNIGDNELPTQGGDVNAGGFVNQLTCGNRHTCALLNGTSIRCWGLNNIGQLGYGNTVSIGDNELPSQAGPVDIGPLDVDDRITQLDAGTSYTCALLFSGVVRCWGDNFLGQLGYGNTVNIGDDETPAQVGNVPLF